MSKIKIIGIGSPFGDDQVGMRVVESLQKQHSIWIDPLHSIEFIVCDRPGIRLLELIQDATMVWLVDAVVSGKPPGYCYRWVNEEINEMKCLLSTHDLGLAQTLQIGSVLNQLPKTLIFYGIEIDKSSTGQDLSCKVLAASVALIDSLAKELSSHFSINSLHSANARQDYP